MRPIEIFFRDVDPADERILQVMFDEAPDPDDVKIVAGILVWGEDGAYPDDAVAGYYDAFFNFHAAKTVSDDVASAFQHIVRYAKVVWRDIDERGSV